MSSGKDESLKEAESETITVNGVSYNMIKVEGGTFKMGADPEYGSDVLFAGIEDPVHSVTLSTYYIGETEVPYDLWEAVLGPDHDNNPGEHTGGPTGRYPVNRVTWNRCQDFVEKLSSLTGKTFRLPTEEEWEYAARGGNKSKGYAYSGSNNIDDVAWYRANSHDIEMGMYSPDWGTHAVALKTPNELGLYDMTGNLVEWCLNKVLDYDGIHDAYICRVGCWWDTPWNSRLSIGKERYKPDVISVNIGFRIVMTN